MKVSFASRFSSVTDKNGYGYATSRIMDSLNSQGHDARFNYDEAPVRIWFDQPQHHTWDTDQYRIAYHPWESTRLKDGWVDKLNEADEVWTPSPLVSEWYRADGVIKPIKVFEHGIEPAWSIVERSRPEKLRFLHVGGEAVRKGADIVLDAFRIAFNGRQDVELVLKMQNRGWNIKSFGKITVLNESVSFPELVKIYHDSHVFVYPSWGEGFGFNPLQAMATGMPTLCVDAWAPYRDLIEPSLRIPSKLTDSPWPEIHPGKMFKPDLEALVYMLRHAADNYEDLEAQTRFTARFVHERYDWNRLVKEAFEPLENI